MKKTLILLVVTMALYTLGCSSSLNTIHTDLNKNFKYEAGTTSLELRDDNKWHGNCVAWSITVYCLADAKGLDPVMVTLVRDGDVPHRVTMVDGLVSSNGEPFTTSLEKFILKDYTPRRIYSKGAWYKVEEFNFWTKKLALDKGVRQDNNICDSMEEYLTITNH